MSENVKVTEIFGEDVIKNVKKNEGKDAVSVSM